MFKTMLGGFALVAAFGVIASTPASADGGDVSQGGTTPSCPGEGDSFEGYFGKSEMFQFVSCALPYVHAFLDDQYADPPAPFDVLVVERDASGPTGCTDADGTTSEFSDLSFEYCPVDQTVYLGEETVWGFYEFNGDVAAMFGIAHEFGHHIQLMARVLQLPDDQATAIAQENQADCIAGAWLGYMGAHGYLELPDDLRDVEGAINAVASAEGPDRDHGTFDERRASVDLGVNGGLVACNDFFPGLPVFVPAA